MTARPERRLSRRRLTAWPAVAVLVVVAVAGAAFVADREHWLDQERRSALHEASIIGGPAGFRAEHSNAADDLATGWNAPERLAAHYYVGNLTPAGMAKSLDAWLTKAGLPSSAGPAESQFCGQVAFDEPVFGCGNFYRETPRWRVWISVANDEWGLALPATGQPTFVRLGVFVQHRTTLSQLLVPVGRRSGGPNPVSPGFSTALAAGSARVLAWDPQSAGIDIDGATFGPQGQLVTSYVRQPLVIPVGKGQRDRELAVPQWPSVTGEVGTLQLQPSDQVVDAAVMDPEGALWALISNEGLHRADPDGHLLNVDGNRAGSGPPVDGPAIGQAAGGLFDQLAVSADGTAWVATGKSLIRIRNGRLTVVDPALPEVDSVTSDGHNGVYFATPTGLFHLSADGAPTPVAATAGLTHLTSLSVAKDGSVFAVGDGYLRRVTPDGVVTIVAGKGSASTDAAFCAEPVPGRAADVPVSHQYSVAVSPLGGVYLLGCNRMVQIGSS